MKRALFLFAVIAALVSLPSVAQTCTVPYEWCLTGCADVGGYSISGFATMPDAQSFIVGSLSPVQQETVRVTTVPALGNHVIVAYRVLGSSGGTSSVQVGLSCAPSTVLMRGYSAIETAEIDLNQLPADQRSGATVIAVPSVPNDPSTHALLLYVRPERGGVQDSSVGGSR